MKRKYSKAIKIIAARERVRPEVIYAEIQKAIAAGYDNPDPVVQDYWRKIAPDGKVPTPDAVIKALANGIKK